MAKQKSQASNRPQQTASHTPDPKKQAERVAADEDRRDERNKARFTDQTGRVAQDLPEAAHGQNVVDHPSEMTRNLPHQHGGELCGEGGLRGDRQISDADDHGGRKHN